MASTRPSPCGRFIIINGLHLDRTVFEHLAKWSERRGLTPQDGIQLALCLFDERNVSSPEARKTRDDVEAQSSPALP